MSVCLCVCVWFCVMYTSKAPCGPRALTPVPQPEYVVVFPVLSPCFSSPCSPGVTPLILTYPMKCLKPLCGNPSAPIRRTLVLWLLRRQGHTTFYPNSAPPPVTCEPLKNTALAHFLSRWVKRILRSTKCKSVFFFCFFLSFRLCRIEGITFIDE